MIKASIICTALLLNGGQPPVFLEPDQAAVNARVKSEIQAHPEIYPPGKCQIVTEDVTTKMAQEKADLDAKTAAQDAARSSLKSFDKTKVKDLGEALDIMDKLVKAQGLDK